MSKKKERFETEGTVIEALPGTQFRIKLDNQNEILAYLSGKMRRYYYYIRLILGDRVKVVISPYDLTRGHITYRYSKQRREPNDK